MAGPLLSGNLSSREHHSHPAAFLNNDPAPPPLPRPPSPPIDQPFNYHALQHQPSQSLIQPHHHHHLQQQPALSNHHQHHYHRPQPPPQSHPPSRPTLPGIASILAFAGQGLFDVPRRNPPARPYPNSLFRLLSASHRTSIRPSPLIVSLNSTATDSVPRSTRARFALA
ncbi:hypothetical protein CROQUDRAFT_665280 [Cronartium quercuum f. sp. fusiforme G11]|uniref:Uncharacterized protein n=1 Tax=Cronartium quercuum f. sp. fusiforme G11 TaxID=708437 RepID=A0A9P6T6F7_9BASI|nr:hypothetical protein CROQUDRAFT_665280 [Cronartium quercuum f. sp. fusiforme G11]